MRLSRLREWDLTLNILLFTDRLTVPYILHDNGVDLCAITTYNTSANSRFMYFLKYKDIEIQNNDDGDIVICISDSSLDDADDFTLNNIFRYIQNYEDIEAC
jgi:hypothetical protein